MTPGTCQEIIAALERASTIDEIYEICSRICAQFGFDHSASIPISLINPFMCCLGGDSEERNGRYPGLDGTVLDPVLRHCLEHVNSLRWEKGRPAGKEGAPVQQFIDATQEFSLNDDDISSTMHDGPGETGLATRTFKENEEKLQGRNLATLSIVYLLSASLHEVVHRVIGSEQVDINKAELTDREKECLLWAAEGKTSWETAQILHISERTVIFHLQNATRKLKAANRQNAIARAVVMGLITPQLS
jgi:DNA-binding CsgD family transcriptional regulator